MTTAEGSLVLAVPKTSFADGHATSTQRKPPSDLISGGTDWFCYEGTEDRELGGCHRYPIECIAARLRTVRKDVPLTQCAAQKNSAVVTMYAVVRAVWTWTAFPSIKACKGFASYLHTENPDDIVNVSPCTIVGANEKSVALPIVLPDDARAYFASQQAKAGGVFCYTFRTDKNIDISTCAMTEARCASLESSARSLLPDGVVDKCRPYSSVDYAADADGIFITHSSEDCASVRAWLADKHYGPCVHIDL